MIVKPIYPELSIKPDIVYFHAHHTYVPYQVASWHLHNNHIQLQLKHIHSRTQAQEWHKHELFADAEAVEQVLAQTDLRFIGYKVHDEVHGLLGEVTHVEKNIQTLLCITGPTHGCYLPLHDTFIQKIDDLQKVITTQLSPTLLKELQQPL